MRRAAGGGRAHIAQWPLASQFDFRISHFAFRISHSAFRAACERGGGLESQNRPCSRCFRTPFCLADACRSRTVAATSDLPRMTALHTLRSGSRPYVGVKGAAECGLRNAECGMRKCGVRSAECCRWGHGGLESQNRPCSRRFPNVALPCRRVQNSYRGGNMRRAAGGGRAHIAQWPLASQFDFRIPHFAFRISHSAFRAACERGGGLESQNRPCSRCFRTPFCLADACRSRTVAATSDLPRMAALHTLRSGSRPYVGVKGAAECGLRNAECGMRSAECGVLPLGARWP